MPVEFDTIRAEEIRRFLIRRSYDEALQLATQRAQADLAGQLPTGAVVTDHQLKVVDCGYGSRRGAINGGDPGGDRGAATVHTSGRL